MNAYSEHHRLSEAQRLYDAMEAFDDEDPLEVWSSQAHESLTELQEAITAGSHDYERMHTLATEIASAAKHMKQEISLRWLMED